MTTRRDFLGTGAAAAAGLVLPRRTEPAFVRVVDRAELAASPVTAGRPAVIAERQRASAA